MPPRDSRCLSSIRMYNRINLLSRVARGTACLVVVAATFLPVGAQTPDEASPISPDITDQELVAFSKSEPSFAAAALPLVQSRLVSYAEAAETHPGQPLISSIRTVRARISPRPLALTNAISGARLYLDFTTPESVRAGEGAAVWNELGLALLERSSLVLQHYYLAVEYRRGHELALPQLRKAARELAIQLSKEVPAADRLRSLKAQYATFWMDQANEVIPVYRDLIGNAARGGVREMLVLRPLDLPLFAGWTWDQRKEVDEVQKHFIHELSTSTNLSLRIEGFLLAAGRSRTDRAFAAAFTNAVEAIGLDLNRQGTRTAYVSVLKSLLEDRQTKTITDRTRDELRHLYDKHFAPANLVTGTNAPAVAAAPAKPAERKVASGKAAPAAVTPAGLPPRAKPPLSWQVLAKPTDVQYWETLPIVELKSLAKSKDVVANYYLFLRLKDSATPRDAALADAALAFAFEAAFPPAQLEHAKRESDAEERFHWTKTAASTGYPPAQLALGELHIMGHGTVMDLERGLTLVRSSYDLRVPAAETTLAELYACGIGEPRTPAEKPAALFLNAARNDQLPAMMELHHRFLTGFGTVRDQLEASRWLVNAGLHDKTLLDQYIDDTGRARPQPSADLDQFAKTFAVYSHAVIRKQPDAMNYVAEWYERGSVGRKSPIRAYALFSLAHQEGKAPTNALDRVKASLTPSELRAAETLAAQWKRISPDLM